MLCNNEPTSDHGVLSWDFALCSNSCYLPSPFLVCNRIELTVRQIKELTAESGQRPSHLEVRLGLAGALDMGLDLAEECWLNISAVIWQLEMAINSSSQGSLRVCF